MDYIRSLHASDEGLGECFLCRYWADPAEDRRNYVLWREGACLVAFNRFPFNNGHMLVAPARHKGTLDELEDAELSELIRRVRDVQRLLTGVVRAQGFNVGINVGRCAGAGLPDHIHIHVVPRWEGDTNFMGVVGDTRVIPQSMDDLYAELAEAAPRLGLPPLAGAT